jgi:hypothetical protein
VNSHLDFLTITGIRENLAPLAWQSTSDARKALINVSEQMEKLSQVPRNRFIVTAVGNIKSGDLVYRIDNQCCFIFRRPCTSLSLVAIGCRPERTSETSSYLSTFYELTDRLYIDYNNLFGCCVLFDDGLALQKRIAECDIHQLVSERLKTIGRVNEAVRDQSGYVISKKV